MRRAGGYCISNRMGGCVASFSRRGVGRIHKTTLHVFLFFIFLNVGLNLISLLEGLNTTDTSRFGTCVDSYTVLCRGKAKKHEYIILY
jgi:hypothetical protein